MIVDAEEGYIAPEIEVFKIKTRQVLCLSGDELNDYGRENWPDE